MNNKNEKTYKFYDVSNKQIYKITKFYPTDWTEKMCKESALIDVASQKIKDLDTQITEVKVFIKNYLSELKKIKPKNEEYARFKLEYEKERYKKYIEFLNNPKIDITTLEIIFRIYRETQY